MIVRTAPEFRGEPLLRQIAAIGCVATVIFALTVCSRAEGSELGQWAGSAPPSFILPSVEGHEVALGAQHADAVIVHFFATWCEPCREELPALTRLSRRAGSSVRILAISVAEPDARVRRFMQSMPTDFPVLLDADRAVAKSWKVMTLPTTFVLDSHLKPRLVVETDYAWDKVDPLKLIDTLSAGNGPNTSNPLTQNLEGKSHVLR